MNSTFYHFGIYVDDILKSSDELIILGFNIISNICFDTHDEVSLILLENEGLVIELIESHEIDKTKTYPYCHHICFEVEPFDDYVNLFLNQKGFVLFSGERQAPLFDDKKICWFYSKNLGVVELKEK